MVTELMGAVGEKTVFADRSGKISFALCQWTTFTNPGRSGTVGGAFNFLKSGPRAAALRRRGRRRRLSTEIV